MASVYTQAAVHYMTGTGNSFRVASWIGGEIRDRGTRCLIEPIETARADPGQRGGGGRLVALVGPTHGFIAPWRMLRFSMRMPAVRGTHAVIMPTRAGARLFGLYTPGMEGTAGYLIALVLLLKGYRIRSVAGMDMPSNWMSLHSGLHPDAIAGILARGEARVRRLMGRVLSGKTYYPPGGFLQLLFGLLLLPFSMGYLFAGRFFLAKLFFASHLCNGCGICAENCPKRAIRMLGRRAPRPYWTFHCESCMRCMGFCPKKAVEAGHSWGVILYHVTMLPIAVYLLNQLEDLWPGLAEHGAWLQWVLQYPYALVSIFLSYLMFHQLVRIPAANRIFTYTTLTHYYRRYREPRTSLSELRRRV